MNFNKRSLILAASLVLATGAAFSQNATENPSSEAPKTHSRAHKAGRGGHMAAALNLTDTQKEQAKTIREKYRTANTDLRTKMRDLRTRATAAKEANNTAELDSIKQERETLFANAKTSWDSQRAELRAILTPEQQAKFDEIGQHRGKRNQ